MQKTCGLEDDADPVDKLSENRTTMQTAESANDLIASIYDASLDPTLWTSSLLRISDTLGGTTRGIGVVDTAGQGDIVSIRCEPDALDSFITYYAHRNPMLRHLPRAEVGNPFTDRAD